MYSYGSAAEEIEYTVPMVEVSTANRKSASGQVSREQMKRMLLKTLAILVAIVTVLLIRQAQIEALCNDITVKKEELRNLTAVVTEKEMYIIGQTDLNLVENIAVTRLGMKKPDASQYVYIDIRKPDGGQVLAENNTVSGGFAAFINKAKILLEYLY